MLLYSIFSVKLLQCVLYFINKDGEPPKKLGIFCLELGKKNILFDIGNWAEFQPQNRLIESLDIII